MAFPATYDFNYYKGDTFEFRIYPKKNDGTVFDLSGYNIPTSFANTPDYYTDTIAPYDSARFTISSVRGDTGVPKPCFARISDDGTFVQCAITPDVGNTLDPEIEYVYDVEVRKPAGSPATCQYEIVNTLLTGKITITDQITGANPLGYATISNNIIGLTKPVVCGVPVQNIIETAEYSGSVVWSGSPSQFDADTSYTATVVITPKTGYRLIGIPANFFAVESATSVINSADSGTVTVVFPKTEKSVSLSAINGITAPVKNATPNTTVGATSQYTVSLVWKEKSTTDPVEYSTVTGSFNPSTTYAAFITLTPKTGYTLCTGIPEDFFSVTGALNYRNDENSGVVIAEFPETGA